MGEPSTLVESVATPVVTAIPTPIAGEMEGKEGFDSVAAEKDKGKWGSLFVKLTAFFPIFIKCCKDG